MEYQSWNHNLWAIRQNLANAATPPSPQVARQYRTSIRLLTQRARDLPTTAYFLDLAIVFHLQILSLPLGYASPGLTARTLLSTLKLLNTYLYCYKTTMALKKAMFDEFLFYLVPVITSDLLLYVHLNISSAQFALWLTKLKKKLLQLIFNYATQEHIHGDLSRFHSWVAHLIGLRVLKEGPELHSRLSILELLLQLDTTQRQFGLFPISAVTHIHH